MFTRRFLLDRQTQCNLHIKKKTNQHTNQSFSVCVRRVFLKGFTKYRAKTQAMISFDMLYQKYSIWIMLIWNITLSNRIFSPLLESAEGFPSDPGLSCRFLAIHNWKLADWSSEIRYTENVLSSEYYKIGERFLSSDIDQNSDVFCSGSKIFFFIL